jgi:hypothetical protein
MTQIEDDEDWAECEHPYHPTGVIVTNQPGKYDPERNHRSTWVCERRKCVTNAIEWVERGTGEKAWWRVGIAGPFSDQPYPKKEKNVVKTTGKKKSKNKAAKVQRAYDNRERSYAEPTTEQSESKLVIDTDATIAAKINERVKESGGFLPIQDLIAIYGEKPVEPALTTESFAQPRWEVERFASSGSRTPEVRIIDHLTGFVANFDEELATEADVEAAALNEGTAKVEQFMWFLPLAKAYVIGVSSDTEHKRFWSIAHEDSGAGIFDRESGLIHVLDPELTQEEIEAEAHIWNANPEAQFEECHEDRESVHWVGQLEWTAEPPADVAEAFEELATEPPADAAVTTELRPLRVLVVSSSTWSHAGVVTSLIQTLWNGAGNPPLQLLTSGSPHGAEGVAMQLADQVHEVSYLQIADDQVTPDRVDYAFAFVSNASEGATRMLNRLLVLGIPTHVMEETSAIVKEDQWASR